jgi:hypothetical protein
MLLLLVKGFWWAASWPYSTWLLAVDKAMCRMNDDCEPSQHRTSEGQVGIKESNMANELPSGRGSPGGRDRRPQA